jgi:hypothetical protein
MDCVIRIPPDLVTGYQLVGSGTDAFAPTDVGKVLPRG